MGLGLIAIVMEVEDEFDVKLSDAECCRMVTVADLAASVIRAKWSFAGPCPSSRLFYRLRRIMTEDHGIARARIRPTTRWVDLASGKLRDVWQEIRTIDPNVPPLALPAGFKGLHIAITILFVVSWLPTIVIASGTFGVTGTVAFTVLWLIMYLLYSLLIQQFAVILPAGIETVGDTVRLAVRHQPTTSDFPEPGTSARLILEEQIMLKIREIISGQMGLPMEKVQPHSEFVKDIGVN